MPSELPPARHRPTHLLRLASILSFAFVLAITLALLSTASAFAQLSDIGVCAAARPGAPNNFNCTANDVRIADVRVVNGVTSCVAGEPVTLQLAVDFALNATRRYDVGVYVALDGTNPINGSSCLRQQFPTTSPFVDLDGDICGDINSSINNFTPPGTVTVICQPGPTGKLVLPTITFWEQNGSSTCSQVPGTSSKCNLQQIPLAEVDVLGTIEVVKVANPADGTPFTFNATGAVTQNFQLADSATPGPTPNRRTIQVPIRAGQDSTVTIAETRPPGDEWDLLSISCGGNLILAQNSATVTLSAAKPNVTCTFTNRKRAAIRVTKATQPVTTTQPFTFTIAGGTPPINTSVTLVGGQSYSTGFTLPPGGAAYSVNESVLPPGWQQSPWTALTRSAAGRSFCELVIGATRTRASNSTVIPPGHTLECTVENIQDSAIFIEKRVVGTTTPSSFTFALGGIGQLRTVVADSTSPGTTSFEGLSPGTYNLAEVPPGDAWSTSDFSCTLSGGSTGTVNGPSGNTPLTLTAGTTARCVITNTLNGSINIAKQTDPPGDSSTFGVSLLRDGAIQTAWALSHGEVVNSGPLEPATYTGVEVVPPGWRLLSFTCDDPLASDLQSGLFVPAGTTYTCTALNQRLGSITVRKLTRDSLTGSDSFDFTGDLGAFSIATTAGVGQQEFTNLAPGSYTISETVPADWILESAVCVDGLRNVVGDPTTGITLNPGDQLTCTFTDQRRIPAISLVKSVTTDTSGDCTTARNSTTARIGETVTYCFQITNSGNVPLEGPILLNDPILDYTVNDVGSPLAIGAVVVVSTTTAYVTTGVPILNTATVTDTASGVSDDDSALVTVVDIDVELRKEVGFSPDGPFVDAPASSPLAVDVDDSLLWRWIVANPVGSTGPISVTWPLTDSINGVPAPVTCAESVPSPLTLAVGASFTCTLSAPFAAQPGLTVNLAAVRACLEADPGLCAVAVDEAAYLTNPRLTVNKVVLNNFGGTLGPDDFPLAATSMGVTTPVTNGVQISLPPAAYRMSEEMQPGYQLDAIGGDCDAKGDLTMVPGIDYTCTITNSDISPLLTVVKIVDGPVSRSFLLASFDLFVDGVNVATVSPPGGFAGPLRVQSGTRVVSELITPNPDAFSVTIGGDCDAQGNVEVAIGGAYTCIITNTVRSEIFIRKVTRPIESVPFSFDVSWDSAPLVVTPPEPGVSPFLDPGPYAVTETVPSGWQLDGSTCSNGNLPSAITVGPGQAIGCTFLNTRLGTITIGKEVTTQLYTDTFTFQPSWTQEQVTLAPGQTWTSELLSPGAYTVSELPLPGWDLVDVTCDDNDSGGDSIVLAPGENLTCTWTNAPQTGQIAIVKRTDPLFTRQPFTFTTSFSSEPITLSSGGIFVTSPPLVTSILAGRYAVTEVLPSGWTLEEAFCSNEDTPDSIFLGPEAVVICSFTNVIQPGTITIRKVALPTAAADDVLFTFVGDIAKVQQRSLFSFRLADGESFTVNNLVPSSESGPYTVVELPPPGWDVNQTSCDNGEQPTNITLPAGGNVTCTFTNTLQSTIVIEKVVIPADSTQPFTFTSNFTGVVSLRGGESVATPGLLAGKRYTITEVPAPDFALDSAGCSNGQSPDAIIPLPGEVITCTFSNVATTVEIGRRTWNDLNANGLREAGEPPLAGVRIELVTVESEPGAANARTVDSTTSSVAGTYGFTPPPGSYFIRVTAPRGFVFSPAGVGDDDTIDSDVGPDGVSRTVTLLPGERLLTLDAGLYSAPTSDEPGGEPTLNAAPIYLPLIQR